MDNLWAPWRMEFIQDKRLKGGEGPCVFCELGDEEANNKNLVLAKSKSTYVVMNRFPYTNGHLMIVPYLHESNLKNLSKEIYSEILELTAASMEVLTEILSAEGFNCGLNVGRAAGCGILDHFHWHIVPRWLGDNNFMPVLGDVRVMPAYLAATYDRLAGAFKTLPK